MTRRTRILAGAVALVALVFSFAEEVLASTCARMSLADAMPAMEMEGMAPMNMRDMAAAGGAMPDTERGDEEHRCPLDAMLGQGCSAAWSLPSPSVWPTAPAPQGTERTVVHEVRSDLLLDHALFHPPRA